MLTAQPGTLDRRTGRQSGLQPALRIPHLPALQKLGSNYFLNIIIAISVLAGGCAGRWSGWHMGVLPAAAGLAGRMACMQAAGQAVWQDRGRARAA